MPRRNLLVQSGAGVKVRKMMVSLPEEVYKLLRHRSVETDTTMSDIVTQALRKALGIKEGGERGKK